MKEKGIKINLETHETLTRISKEVFKLQERGLYEQPSASWLIEYITPQLSNCLQGERLHFESLIIDNLHSELVNSHEREKQLTRQICSLSELLKASENERIGAKEDLFTLQQLVSELDSERK